MNEFEDVILPDDYEAQPQAEEVTEQEETFETVEPTETVEETIPTEEVAEQQVETPQTIKIKYNHEEENIPYEEAVPLIQKGKNYEKVQQQAEQYQQQLAEIAKITGYQSTDELFQAMELAKQQQQEELYRQAGVDPETFNQLIENNPDVKYAREMRAKQEQDQKFQKEANELFSAFPDLKPDQIPQEVWTMHEQGVPLKFAYMQHDYNNLKGKVKVLQQNKTNEQKAPIGSLTAHGSDEVASTDPFLSGFDSI